MAGQAHGVVQTRVHAVGHCRALVPGNCDQHMGDPESFM